MSAKNESDADASGSDEELSALGDSEDEEQANPSQAKASQGDNKAGVTGATKEKKSQEVKNKPFDEALELSASASYESVPSPLAKAAPANPGGGAGDAGAKAEDAKPDSDDEGAPGRPTTRGGSRGRVDPPPPDSAPGKTSAGGASAKVKNKPFDEQAELEGSESEASIDTDGARSPVAQKGRPIAGAVPASSKTASTPSIAEKDEKKANDEEEEDGEESSGEESSGEESSGEEEDEEEGGAKPKGAASLYNEKEYANLNVSSEIKELFQYIGRYKPQDIELETRLKCFIPDYIPAVGEMDAFLKVPRPDGKADELGMKVLDEPAANQSDPTVLELQLRALSKKQHGDVAVRSIEDAEKNAHEIERWITSIEELHRSKPPPQVNYARSMPDIESLMQVWETEFEDMLTRMDLPSMNTNLDLKDRVRMVCALLDIPVYNNVIESLHVLFTLYSEFISNQHFMNLAQAKDSDDPASHLEEMGIQSDSWHHMS